MRPPSLPTLPRPARLVLRWAVSIAVLVAVALALRGRFTSVAESGVPWPRPESIAATLVLFVIANELLVRGWLALVAMGHGHIPRKLGRWVWAKSQLARYAVGMAQVASRAIVARRHGLRPATSAITTLLEVVWYTCINAAMALATIPWWLADTGLGWAAWLAVLPALVLAPALFAPRLFIEIAIWASRLPVLRKVGQLGRARDLEVSHGETALLTGIYVGNAIIRLAGFWCLYLGVGGPSDQILRVTGAFALGHLIGAVAVFAPGGLGPREGVTAIVLAPILGAGPVLMLVAATRLFELAAELTYAGFARWRWSLYVEKHPEHAGEDDLSMGVPGTA